jgi:glycosyltransferase involved in cell wall biosynthesis
VVFQVKWPKVSVVVITRNEEKNIRDCLDSIVSMDYDGYEVVVADSSSDRTPQIVKSYRGVVLRKVDGPGFGHARNVGVSAARNEIIAFTDADCIVPRNWLRVLVAGFGKGVAGVGGSSYPPPASPYLGVCIACLGFPAGGVTGTESMGNCLSTCNAAFRKDVLEELGGFDERFAAGGEDQDICERITGKYRIKLVRESFVYHKTRTGWEFLRWSYRRGVAKTSRGRKASDACMVFKAAGFPFSKKYRMLFSKRRDIGINLLTIAFVIPPLFLMKQLAMWMGWLHGS